jgi:hypothetical protein
MIKSGIIWAEGVHKLWIDNKPVKLKVTTESLARDYALLKANLPIPIGIDHIKDEVLASNPILAKMNLLNVGEIREVELKAGAIHIKQAELTNPQIKSLYAAGELGAVSIVSNIKPRPCLTGEVDYIEEYNTINRVDFVGKGGCETCKVDAPMMLNAKTILKGDMMVDKTGKDNKLEGGDGDEVTLETVAEQLTEMAKTVKDISDRVTTLEDGEKQEKEGEDPEEEKGVEASAADSEAIKRIKKLEKELKASKAEAAHAEAAGIVNKYLKEGKLFAKQVKSHVAMAMATPEEYKTSMDDAPVVVDLKKLSQAQANNPEDTEDQSYDAYLKATGQDKQDK